MTTTEELRLASKHLSNGECNQCDPSTGYICETCDAAKLMMLAAKEIDRLEAEVARLSKPDQWWDWNDGESAIGDLFDWFDSAGMNVTGGEVFRFQAAKTLPDEYYEVKADGDGKLFLNETTKEAWDAHRLLQKGKP